LHRGWRTLTGLLAAIILVLAHEYMTQGYLFRISDVWVPRLTHEKILLALISIFFILFCKKPRRR